MVVVLLDEREDVYVRQVSLWQRAFAWLRADRLDQALAAGRNPDGSLLLAIRARHLMRSTERSTLARSVELMVEHANRPTRPVLASSVTRPDIVHDVQGDLLTLAAALRDPRPVSVKGMAKAHVLLTDGSGPLHLPGSLPRLRATLEEAVDALRPEELAP